MLYLVVWLYSFEFSDECGLKIETKLNEYTMFKIQPKDSRENESRFNIIKLNIFENLSFVNYNSCENMSEEWKKGIGSH